MLRIHAYDNDRLVSAALDLPVDGQPVSETDAT